MKIGLIGDGGREHALARGICSGAKVDLYVAAKNKNDGIIRLAKDYRLTGYNDPARIVDYFKENKVELVVIGPEATLMLGIVDLLKKDNIQVVGPTRKQASLEGDKAFMRELLQHKLGWGSPLWKTVSSIKEAEAFIQLVGEAVVKPVGLTGGRGVRVMGIQLEDTNAAVAYVQELLEKDAQVLLEERVVGEEFSRMAFVCDGDLVTMPLLQDFKYANDGDHGLMTGGMGAYSFADGTMPFITSENLHDADHLLLEVVKALEEETDQSYRGFLYDQFIAFKEGIRLIEFNVRLGDPEAVNVMIMLKNDPIHLFANMAAGNLTKSDALFYQKALVSKYLVPMVQRPFYYAWLQEAA